MEFVDDYDECRLRIIFQSRPKPSITVDSAQNPLKNHPMLIISLTFSLLSLGLSFTFLNSQLLNPLFLWLFLSFLLGPFAPISITAGDIRVGRGRIVDLSNSIESIDDGKSKKKFINKINRGKRSDLNDISSNGSIDFVKINENSGVSEELGFENPKNKPGLSKNDVSVIGEKEWSSEEMGWLRKQLVKYPVGKPRRWEVIGDVFKGNHSLESVINKAKSLGKEKPDDSDSYSKFLKDRKPNEKKEEGDVGGGVSEEVIVWSSDEDIALLNALKTFPKDLAMWWDKISAAVPGKSKSACMKRVTDLKKEFRSSKAD